MKSVDFAQPYFSRAERRPAPRCHGHIILVLLVVFVFVIIIFSAICFFSLAFVANVEESHNNVSFDVAPKDDRIVFSSAVGDLFLFDLVTEEVRQLTDTESIDTNPVFSPDGNVILFARRLQLNSSSHIYALDLLTKSVSQITYGENINDIMPSYSVDGSQIAFARAHLHRPYSMGGWTWDEWDVYVADSDGENVRRLTNKNYYGLQSPRFARDGKSVLYSAEANRHSRELHSVVFQVAIDGTQPPTAVTTGTRAKLDFAALGSEPAVSPDGQRVAFISDRQEPFNYDAYLMKSDGTEATPLHATRVSRYNQSPRFSPDGKHVYFLAATDWSAESQPLFSLWRIPTDAGQPEQIADQGLFDFPLGMPDSSDK